MTNPGDEAVARAVTDAQRQTDRDAAVDWARRFRADPAAVVLDTETTTVDNGRVIEIAVVDATGKVLLDSLVNPGEPIDPDAFAVHGISDDMVRDAPRFIDLVDQLGTVLAGRRIGGWNTAYDQSVLNAEYQMLISEHSYAVHSPWLEIEWADVMWWHAQWAGDFDPGAGRYRPHKLNGVHRAVADCRATWDRIGFLADLPTSADKPHLLRLRGRANRQLRPRYGTVHDYVGVEAVVDTDEGFGYQFVQVTPSKETKLNGAFFLAPKGSIDRREWIPFTGDPYAGFREGAAALCHIADTLAQAADLHDEQEAEHSDGPDDMPG